MATMANAKALIRTALVADATLTALVPATRILSAWPDVEPTYPIIVIQLIDSFVADMSLFDDQPYSDQVSIQIDAWNKPGLSLTAIFNAINAVMEAQRWNRDSAIELVEPETKLQRLTCRYSNVLLRV